MDFSSGISLQALSLHELTDNLKTASPGSPCEEKKPYHECLKSAHQPFPSSRRSHPQHREEQGIWDKYDAARDLKSSYGWIDSLCWLWSKYTVFLGRASTQFERSDICLLRPDLCRQADRCLGGLLVSCESYLRQPR